MCNNENVETGLRPCLKGNTARMWLWRKTKDETRVEPCLYEDI